jgi:hypothetical protein
MSDDLYVECLTLLRKLRAQQQNQIDSLSPDLEPTTLALQKLGLISQVQILDVALAQASRLRSSDEDINHDDRS